MSTTINWKILNAKFSDSEVQRQEMDQFKLIQRGSMRFCMNRVRTEAEQRKFVRRGKSTVLPRR